VLAPKIKYEPLELIKVLLYSGRTNAWATIDGPKIQFHRLERVSPSSLPSRSLMRYDFKSPKS